MGAAVSALAGAVADPGQYAKDIKGRVARAITTSSSATTTTEVGVLRLDSVPVLGGHTYTIRTSSLLPVSTVANDYVGTKIRYTSDGTTATTSSTQLLGTQTRITGASGNETVTLAVTYNPASDQNLSILLSASRVSGTGNCSIGGGATTPIELWIDHDGEDPGNTGLVP